MTMASEPSASKLTLVATLPTPSLANPVSAPVGGSCDAGCVTGGSAHMRENSVERLREDAAPLAWASGKSLSPCRRAEQAQGVIERVRASRADQGLPLGVEDPGLLAALRKTLRPTADVRYRRCRAG